MYLSNMAKFVVRQWFDDKLCPKGNWRETEVTEGCGERRGGGSFTGCCHLLIQFAISRHDVLFFLFCPLLY